MITRAEWRRRQKIRRLTRLGTLIILGIAVILALIFGIKSLFSDDSSDDAVIKDSGISTERNIEKPDISEKLLTVNEYSRPGTKLDTVKGIVIHGAPDAGSTAEENRNYYEELKNGTKDRESVHFIIGSDGVIIQCIPLDEISYSAKERNLDTISVECCYSDVDGKFPEAVNISLTELVRWLCSEYGLKRESILRHYDVTGANCPKYYVGNDTEWKLFLDNALKE